MITPRLFIGPMSKEIVDSVINYANTNDNPLDRDWETRNH